MRKHILYCLATLLLTPVYAGAQESYTERVKKYIDQYYNYAIEQQRINGIPASITLGQGILETEAGASELMTEANNHFGIKCKNGWSGETFLHTDDAKDECFKKYKCAADSYKDHSEHLKINPRYSPLFKLSTTDYAAWAVCLKKCGYATNPQYAQRLIKIIEDFKLQEYTYAALDSANNYPGLPVSKPLPVATTEKVPFKAAPAATALLLSTAPIAKTADTVKVVSAPVSVQAPPPVAVAKPDTIIKQIIKHDTIIIAEAAPVRPDTVKAMVADTAKAVVATAPESMNVPEVQVPHDFDSSKIITVNGMKAVQAYKDDILLQYAVKYRIRYAQLLEMNDLADGPLPFDCYVYLQKKPGTGIRDKHTVTDGETLLMIAQKEGIQLKKLAAMNLMATNEDPATGAVLELQTDATKKPEVKLVAIAAHKENTIEIASVDPVQNADNYIATNKPAEPAAATPNVPASTPAPSPAPVVAAATPAADTATNSDDEEEEEDTKTEKATGKGAATAPATKSTAGNITTKTPDNSQDQPKAAPVVVQAVAVTPTVFKPEVKIDEKEISGDEELANLKAKLDKVVYAEPGKLPDSKEDPSQHQLARPHAEDDVYKGPKSYTVKKGDTAYAIAKKFNVTVRDLMKWNSLEPEEIRAGQVLKVKE